MATSPSPPSPPPLKLQDGVASQQGDMKNNIIPQQHQQQQQQQNTSSPPPPPTSSSVLDTFACGTAAGFVTEMILYPLEHPSLLLTAHNSSSSTASLRLTVKEMVGVAVTRAPTTGLLMACYEFAKTFIVTRIPQNTIPEPFIPLAAGILATGGECLILTPFVAFRETSRPSSLPTPSTSTTTTSKPTITAPVPNNAAIHIFKTYTRVFTTMVLTTAPFVSFYYFFSDLFIARFKRTWPHPTIEVLLAKKGITSENDDVINIGQNELEPLSKEEIELKRKTRNAKMLEDAEVRRSWMISAVSGALGGSLAIIVSAPLEMLRARATASKSSDTATAPTPTREHGQQAASQSKSTATTTTAKKPSVAWSLLHQSPRFAFRRAFYGIVRASSMASRRTIARAISVNAGKLLSGFASGVRNSGASVGAAGAAAGAATTASAVGAKVGAKVISKPAAAVAGRVFAGGAGKSFGAVVGRAVAFLVRRLVRK
ncbi:hypothetical protein HDU76_000649 [Blyttiomyces sp. JEL0837]|nr:hypothetical protein HDU76_000649 [Blyttiomyces sp. JEL0837]